MTDNLTVKDATAVTKTVRTTNNAEVHTPHHIVDPATSGGLTPKRILTATMGVVKASAGQVYVITAYNVSASVRYLHLYDKATAPTLSSDTPILTVPLLGASVRDIKFSDIGVAFAAGIAWAYTTDDIAIPASQGTSTELHAMVYYA